MEFQFETKINGVSFMGPMIFREVDWDILDSVQAVADKFFDKALDDVKEDIWADTSDRCLRGAATKAENDRCRGLLHSLDATSYLTGPKINAPCPCPDKVEPARIYDGGFKREARKEHDSDWMDLAVEEWTKRHPLFPKENFREAIKEPKAQLTRLQLDWDMEKFYGDEAQKIGECPDEDVEVDQGIFDDLPWDTEEDCDIEDFANDKCLHPFMQTAVEMANLVIEKNEAYGDSFKKSGEFMKMLYPDGIRPDQYQNVLTIVRMFDKFMRIATDPGAFNEDPWKDLVGYSILAATHNKKPEDSDGTDA